jgi:hypothetical protein
MTKQEESQIKENLNYARAGFKKIARRYFDAISAGEETRAYKFQLGVQIKIIDSLEAQLNNR